MEQPPGFVAQGESWLCDVFSNSHMALTNLLRHGLVDSVPWYNNLA